MFTQKWSYLEIKNLDLARIHRFWDFDLMLILKVSFDFWTFKNGRVNREVETTQTPVNAYPEPLPHH